MYDLTFPLLNALILGSVLVWLAWDKIQLEREQREYRRR